MLTPQCQPKFGCLLHALRWHKVNVLVGFIQSFFYCALLQEPTCLSADLCFVRLGNIGARQSRKNSTQMREVRLAACVSVRELSEAERFRDVAFRFPTWPDVKESAVGQSVLVGCVPFGFRNLDILGLGLLVFPHRIARHKHN